MHGIIIGFLLTGFIIRLLFISVKMALEQTIKDLQTQSAQFQEMFLNLSKGQEELKTLFIESMTNDNPEDDKESQIRQLQAEVATMRIQMLGQMALIQNLARGQEELRTLVNKLHQNSCNHMKQTIKIGDQVTT